MSAARSIAGRPLRLVRTAPARWAAFYAGRLICTAGTKALARDDALEIIRDRHDTEPRTDAPAGG